MSESNQARTVDSLRHEYEQVAQSLRHYSNLRFVMFAISFAVIGVVAHVAFSKGGFDEGAMKVARAGGFLLVAMFWLYQERMSLWWNHYRRAAMDLERQLGYNPSTTEAAPLGFLPSVTLLTRVFYFLIFVFWAYAFGLTP
jgi:hypothetical protein